MNGAELRRLPVTFYARGAAEVAPDLLGKLLVAVPRVPNRSVRSPAAPVVGRIVETEAYVGERDLACHAAKGLTKRTKTLFGPPGTAYVYLIYGVHDMLNVVVAAAGEPQAVLVRAAELLSPASIPRAASGPGKLTKVFDISREDDATSLDDGRIGIFEAPPPARVGISARIGVAYAGEWADVPLRFFDADSPAVSGPKRLRGG